LDIYTIREELGTVNGLDIALVGDLKHGRTTHSLVKLLSLYNVRLHYVSPPSLRMPKDIMDRVAQSQVVQKEYTSLEEVAPFIDVLYMTRIQKERFETQEEYLSVSRPYVVNTAVMNKMKPNMVVLHPLPRIDEIETEVDLDPRAAYFRQMKYGLYVRMAVLLLILGKA
jgi:aspartate carbamoyltransferase catalytic subunit